MQHDIIRFRDVSVCYGSTVAVDHITANIHCGSRTALLGPNGAGKSTLLRAILGWHPLASGEIRIGDSHAQHALPRLAYLPQRPDIDWDFPITVRGVVEQGRYPSLGAFGLFTKEDRIRVDQALEELDLTELANRQINRLSGGQQQRMFLARALAQGADIFLLDEPFSGLDIHSTEELTHILQNWNQQGRTVLAVVHDLAIARVHFPHALLINTGLIASGTTKEVLTGVNINRAFRQIPCHHHNRIAAANKLTPPAALLKEQPNPLKLRLPDED